MSEAAGGDLAGPGGPTWTVPGKLMLAGEYAVVRAEGRCLAVAVGEVVRASTWDGPGAGVRLVAFGQQWQVSAEQEAKGLAGFVAAALRWLALRHGLVLRRSVRLDVVGAIGGHKVGLGTSAAVTVATVRAVLRASGQVWPAQAVARAAREIHGAAQDPPGSGYDVTTIAHGGVIAWDRAADRVQQLGWPTDLYGAALFSGASASTGDALLRQALTPAHLDAIESAAERLHRTWHGPTPELLDAFRGCQRAYDSAARDDPHLVSDRVESLRASIEAHGCVVRTSGAGGGDCVLALADDARKVAALTATWEAHGGHVVAQLPRDIAAMEA